MNKRNTKIFALTSMSGIGMVAAFAATVAWFMTSIKINQINGTGYTDAAYFAYGTGTAEDPFGIADTKHLNNLAWLQYNGNFDSDHFYFELANDINADGSEFVIPPIGTESHPFKGVFDGQGYTISNIKVTNDSSEFSKKPHNISYSQSDAEIVGFFGVVGNLEDEAYDSQVNSLHNVTLDNLTVESKTQNTLIGLAAGYINADMSGVKVGTSKIKTQGQAAKTAYTDKLSDYGLVGYTTKTGSSGTFEQRLSQYYNSKSDGDDAGWGGSIAIKDLYGRLDTMRNSYARSQNSNTVPMAYTDTYNPEGELVSHTSTRNINSALYVYNETTTRNGVTYNDQVGALQTNYGTNGIYYLSGGHYATKQYQSYYNHSGFPVTDGTNYMTVTGRNVSSSDRIINTTDSSEALLWSYSNNRLVTQYNGTNYYLRRYSNTDLRLTNSTSYAVSLTKETSGDKFRYIYNGTHYLKFNNGSWIFAELPTLRTEPTPVAMPTETIPMPSIPKVEEPTIWRPASDPGAESHYYYIYSGNNYLNSNASNTAKTNSNATTAVQWELSGELTSSLSGAFIRNASTTNYLRLYRGGIFSSITLSTTDTPSSSNNNSTNWNIALDGTNTATIRNANRTGYYVRYNNSWSLYNGSATVSIYSVHQAYLDWQAYDVSQVEWGPYEANQAAWAAYNAYVEDKESWDLEVIAYNAAVPLTYALVTEALPDVEGPDQYIDSARTTQGMNYSEQDVTYLPITINGDNDLTAKSTNTGYIIGGSVYANASASYDNGKVRVASFYTISDNLTNYNRNTGAFNEDSVWTRDASGLHQIDDDDNDFVKYLESKGKVEQTLSGGNNIYGLHFMSAAINKDYLVNARYAMINGEEYTDYKMPANSIDFNLKEQGYINFFAGTYGNLNSQPTTVDSFFSLHMIKRNGTNIDDINEIEEIYSDGIPYHSYIYRFSNGKYSVPYSIDKYNPKKVYILNTKTPLDDVEHGGYADGIYHQIDQSTFNTNYSSFSSIFQMSWLKDYSYPSGQNGYHQGFYFEIPTNPGEYALGTVANKSFGAYLMYLDIAANASNKDQITAYAITTFQSGLKFPAGIDFNTTDVQGNNGGETLAIIIVAGSSSSGDIDFTVSGTTITYDGDFATQYAYSEKPASGASPPAAADLPPSTGTRVIYTHILTTDYLEWDIQVTEVLDENGDATSSTVTSVKCGGEPVTVEDIPESFVLNSIRSQVNSYIATFVRLSGDNEFSMVPTYGGDDYKTVSIAVEMNGTTLEVNDIATGYSITLNGTPVSNNQTYPSN